MDAPKTLKDYIDLLNSANQLSEEINQNPDNACDIIMREKPVKSEPKPQPVGYLVPDA